MLRSQSASRHVLVLYDCSTGTDWQTLRPCVRQHLRTLEQSPHQHRILYHNVRVGIPWLLRQIRFDAVVFHNTALCYRWSTELARWRASLQWLESMACLKIAIPQDEYNWSEVLDDWLDELGVSVICTNFGVRFRPLFYPKMHRKARFLRCLTGYIDEAAAQACAPRVRPIAERPRDIVYRASHLPYWYGGQGQLKHQVGSIVAARAAAMGLACDISTRREDTIVSNAWYDFLGSSKAVLGCESGSSVFNPRGEIVARVDAILARQPDLSYAEVSEMLPRGWADYRFFAIGPRHLEAIYTRTCQVLVEGEYDGVLKPMRHYLPIRRDFGNLDEVLHMIKDHALLQKTADRAYEEIFESRRFRYATFARLMDVAVTRAPRGPRWLPWPLLVWLHPRAVSFLQFLDAVKAIDWRDRFARMLPGFVRAMCRPIFKRVRAILKPMI